MSNRGQEVRLHFTSADAQTAAYISIYDIDGKLLALDKFGQTSGMPAAGSRLAITSLNIVIATAACKLLADHDEGGDEDAGEILAVVKAAGTLEMDYPGVPLWCGKGMPPKIHADGAGQVDLTGTGFLVRI